jgi:plastocyanin
MTATSIRSRHAWAGAIAALGAALALFFALYGPASAAAPRAAGGVKMKNLKFRPSTLTVSAGTQVTFTNKDTVKHTATLAGTFNTHGIKPGKAKSVLFSTPGTYDYHCSIHSFMHGKIVVD